MSKSENKIVITAALPYANGEIHIGHLLEHIQADIYSRFLKLLGNEVLYICASDMHGTPVEVNAQKAGKDPEKFALEFWKDHQHDFQSFFIEFDNYYKTHSPESKELVEHFFTELNQKGYIYTKKVNVIYCDNCKRTLPDRYVLGACPHCGTESQYGDICENCNSILKGTDLINPKCSLCGRTPRQKESEHYFFALSKFAPQLKKWISSANIQKEVQNWLNEWTKKGLEDWCISRDAPYFGFKIPGSKKETGEDKYFYVWLDAPIGYISSTKNYCDKRKSRWETYWKSGQVQHFIGKDIVYFHYLFWPAMLMAVGIPLPNVTTHGFVTVNGQKMSKSRGTFFTAKDFLKLYPPESLRFFYASRLDRKLVDIDLNFEEFIAVNNNVLMGSLGNFCYRVLTFAEKNYGLVKEVDKENNQEVMELVKKIEGSYQEQDYKNAVKYILQVADLGNAYFQKSEVWKDKDNPLNKAKVGWCVNLARNLAILVSPILPEFSAKIMKTLGEKKWCWKDLGFDLKRKLGKVELLVQKVEKLPSAAKFPLKMMVGEIKEVKDHPQADTLYLMQVSFGRVKKQVVAGLKKYFPPAELRGRKAVFCVNLKPAKIRGETSEAMILVADDGENVGLLEVEKTEVGEEVNFTGYESGYKEVTFDEFKSLRMIVENHGVVYEKKKLASKVEEVIVRGVRERAGIY